MHTQMHIHTSEPAMKVATNGAARAAATPATESIGGTPTHALWRPRDAGRGAWGRWVWGVAVAATLLAARADAAGFPPSETLLPATTRVWASAADPQGLRQRFERSALGGLVYEPLMSTFLDGLRQQGRSSIDPLRGSLEITPAEVAKIAGGEVAFAAVERADGTLATLLLVDTTGRDDAVKPIVEDLVARVSARGAKPLAAPAGSRAFAVPPPAGAAAGAAAGAGGKPAAATGAGNGRGVSPRQLAIAERPGAIVFGDRIDAVADLAAAIDAAPAAAGSLAAVPAFVTTMDRTGRGLPAADPAVRWFADPLAYLAADRRTNPPRSPRKAPDYAAILARHGFDVITGVGGRVFFGAGGADGIDLRANTLVCAPGANGPASTPATGAAKADGRAARMLRFPNVSGLAPATWVPAGAASWTAFEWDIADAFDALPPLVDDLVGEDGVFEDVVASLKEDPDGPQIDIDGDFVRHLGRRVVVARDHVAPLGVDSERTLIAIETGNAEAVAGVLAKGIATEGDVRRVEASGHVIWETVPQGKTGPQGKQASAAAERGEADDAAGRRRAGGRERREREPAWPNLSVTVANGHIFLASHRDFLERVLAAAPEPSIAGEERYRRAAAAREGLLPGDVALTTFTDTGRLVRPAWNLLREGRLPESRGLAATMLMRVLDRDRADGGPAAGAATRKQEVDGSSLPEFDLVRKYFGTTAAGMQSTPEGWYIVGVSLWDGAKASAPAVPGGASGPPAAAR